MDMEEGQDAFSLECLQSLAAFERPTALFLHA